MLQFIPAVLLVITSAESPQMSVLVMPVEHSADIADSTADAVQSVIAAELSRSKGIEVVSSKDLERLLSLSADRELLGCVSMEMACSTDLAAALGARHLITASLAKAKAQNMKADFIVATITLLDAESAVALGRERILGRTPLEVAERVRFVAGRLATRLSGGSPEPLPPLVATRQMSDDNVIAGASVVGVSTALVSSLGMLPWVAQGLTSPFFVPLEVVGQLSTAVILPVPVVAGVTAAIASLLVDVATDEPMNAPRALLVAALTSGTAFIVIPVVLGSAFFAGFLAHTLILGFPSTDEEETARRSSGWAVAGLASPLIATVVALMTIAGVTLGVGLFDEERVISEGTDAAPENMKTAQSMVHPEMTMWFVDTSLSRDVD